MFKETWLNFVGAISLLLMISCVSWIFMTYLVLQVQIKVDEEYPNGNGIYICVYETDPVIHSQCSLFTFFNIMNNTSYTLGAWLFTMRFWSLSIVIESLFKQKNFQDRKKMVWWVEKLGILANFTCSFGMALAGQYRLTWAHGWTNLFLSIQWFTISAFLFSGLFRIRHYMKSQSNVVLVYKNFYLLIFTAFIPVIVNAPNFIKVFTVENFDHPNFARYERRQAIYDCIINGSLFIFQVGIIYIFH